MGERLSRLAYGAWFKKARIEGQKSTQKIADRKVPRHSENLNLVLTSEKYFKDWLLSLSE